MAARCPNCREVNRTAREPYAENVVCTNCGAIWRTQETVPIRHALPGCHLDFEDWSQLLGALSPQVLNREVLSHVGLRLATQDGGLIDEHGAEVSAENAHVRIQEDPEAQRALYQRAMDLWR